MFGLYEVQILLQLYESIFLSKLLFNCQPWTSLRKSSNIPSLESMQYKYLKQTMHIPYSTPNAGLLLELGILPIKDVINIRKLTFLHHILSLTCDDPVLKLYKQQKKLIYKNNWANEVSWLHKHYEIKETDCEIKKYKMEKWKILQKNKGASV